MPIYAFEGKRPTIESSAYISPTAVVIGNVNIGKRCYVGHGAVLRGDWGTIEIGDETAIEEETFVHVRPDDLTKIGRRVTLGHGAMVHNATIGECAVIGMRAVVSDFSEVGSYTIVGEMGLVRRGQKVPSRKIAVGVPVQIVGDVNDERFAKYQRAKDRYVNLAKRCNGGALVEIKLPYRMPATIGSLTPIGTVRTPFKHASGTPIQGALSDDVEGEVILDSAFQDGLADLDGFSHIMLIYAFHRMDGFKLKVKPYLDKHERGIFSTRSPCRPNPIGMTVVRLIEIDGCRLKVSGVDMLDETPLLDIKPSIPAFDYHSSVRCGWFESHLRRLNKENTIPVADNRFHRDDER
ncbi:MAG: tRNA (N6-threonylcarbamoyladenosine(37)-N6)-methyltransferase TrmO [Proteobacteria bacterium]|nr:tRNA (N6-threonylcarbamoyladenosine(37)-N6)-methyltransferase TrmO [Pseudomonadota bacterium]